MTASSPASPRARSPAGLILRELRPADRSPLEAILRGTGVFTGDEVAVALELIDHGINPEGDKDYRFVVAALPDGAVAGYACHGPTPLTEGVHDLYWIAVDRSFQGQGIGVALLRAVESKVRAEGGSTIIIETASKPSYAATRAFYERNACRLIDRVSDFYAPGDDKLTYSISVRCQAPD